MGRKYNSISLLQEQAITFPDKNKQASRYYDLAGWQEQEVKQGQLKWPSPPKQAVEY